MESIRHAKLSNIYHSYLFKYGFCHVLFLILVSLTIIKQWEILKVKRWVRATVESTQRWFAYFITTNKSPGPLALTLKLKNSISFMKGGANAIPWRRHIKISFVKRVLASTFKSSPEQMILLMSQFGRCSSYVLWPPQSPTVNVFCRRSQAFLAPSRVGATTRKTRREGPGRVAFMSALQGALSGEPHQPAPILLSYLYAICYRINNQHMNCTLLSLFNFDCWCVNFDDSTGILIPLQGITTSAPSCFEKKMVKFIWRVRNIFLSNLNK